jgi:hypothetical protein
MTDDPMSHAEPIELIAYIPRRRVMYVGGPDAVKANTAAAELEAAGFIVDRFQFETWVDRDDGVNDCVWITYELPDGVDVGPDTYVDLTNLREGGKS